jgi:hypothetical protein
MPTLRITPAVAPPRVRHAKASAASAVGTPVGYSQAELDACLARMRDAQPDTLANTIRRAPAFFGEPFTIPPNNIIADVLDTNTAAMSDAYITRAVVLYADAILSPEAVPSAWPGPMLRPDGRTSARTTFAVEAWKQRLVQGLALGLASPALRAVYAEAIMSICRGWRTLYVTKPSGDPVVPRPVTASQAGASAVGVVTAGVNTVTNYLRGQSQEQLAQTVYGIGSTALDQRAAQSVNTAESQALLAVAAARLANAARAEQAALAASTPQASSSEPTKSNAGAIVAGVIGVGAIGGLAWWYSKKRKK